MRLAKKKCQHEEKQETRISDEMATFKPARCTGIAEKNGWCELHQPSVRMLELGEKAGYPNIFLNSTWEIGTGFTNWQGFARRAAPKRLQDLKEALAKREEEMHASKH